MNGNGIFVYKDGSKYDGEWKDGEKNGDGIWTSVDGFKYVGKFKNGQRNGKGTWTCLLYTSDAADE